jgi:hypothetical protein
LRPFWDGERISSLRTLAIGERVGKAGSDLFRSPMKGALMRDFRDAKVMARALRDALKAQAIETTHTEALELIAKAFGCKSWNVLSAKIEAAEPKPIHERSLSPGGTRDRHAERADPSQITRDYIARPARLAVKDIGYEQRGWDKALVKVYLHGQSVDLAQGRVSIGNKGVGDQGIMFGYAAGRPVAHHISKVRTEGPLWHTNPNQFVIGELRRGQIIGFRKIIPGT